VTKLARVMHVVAATLFGLAAAACCARGDEAQEAQAQGNTAFLHGDFPTAIRRYSDAIRLNPNDPVAYNNRAYAYLQSGDSDKAIVNYDEALRLDPAYAKAYFYRGSAYEDIADWNKAAADYTAAVRLDAKYARAYCSRGKSARAPALFADVPPPPARKAADAGEGPNFFVAPNGSDHNRGTIDRPFATLYKALQWVRPGETINLRAGTYSAGMIWNKSGSAAAPITIQAYNGEDVRLQASEQYAWTRVADPVFGDCWKVTIQFRTNNYRGLQHTVWEDAAEAVKNPGVQVFAIVKGGSVCASMHSAYDFARPQAAAGTRLTDNNGALAYDITWYDRGAKTLWFKPGPSHITDPSRELYVTSTSSSLFTLAASCVRLKGLKFGYLGAFSQQPGYTGCELDHCEIKHTAGGFCGSGTRCTYTSLFIDRVGDWLTWTTNGYVRAYQAHCFYFNGTRCIVANSFFGRSNKGGPIQNYPEGVTENLFDSNVLYNSDGGSIFMGKGRNYITNNVSLQKTAGFGPYVSMQGFTFANNYCESAWPFNCSCIVADGVYAGTFEKFAITGNVFNNTGGRVEYRGNMVDAKECRIDGNVYLGSQLFSLGLTQANPPASSVAEYTNYAAYATALQAMPGCAAWEKKSRAGTAAPRFGFATFDAFLDSDPPLATVLLKIRQYVKNVTAPFPGAGPAIRLGHHVPMVGEVPHA
jgi:tetratricopeptide (TPR) repeat protein